MDGEMGDVFLEFEGILTGIVEEIDVNDEL